MEGFQMSMFGIGSEESISDADFENSKKVREAYHNATKYGHVQGLKHETYETLTPVLNAYADGVAITLELDLAEREMVANMAFASADAVMQGKRH